MTQIDIAAPINEQLALRSSLSKYDLRPARYILIASRSSIVRRYKSDENVWYRLMEEGNVAMNRNSGGELEIFVALNLHEDSLDEIVISVLHEVEHLRGIEDEREAEDNARTKFWKGLRQHNT